MKGFIMGADIFNPLWKITEIIMTFAAWLICTTGGLVAICMFIGAIGMAIKDFIDELKKDK